MQVSELLEEEDAGNRRALHTGKSDVAPAVESLPGPAAPHSLQLPRPWGQSTVLSLASCSSGAAAALDPGPRWL